MPSMTLIQPHPASDRSIRAVDLLSRYPDVTDAETERLIRLVSRLDVVEMNAILADPSVGRQLDLLHRDHGRRLRPSATLTLAAAAVSSAVILLFAWWFGPALR